MYRSREMTAMCQRGTIHQIAVQDGGMEPRDDRVLRVAVQDRQRLFRDGRAPRLRRTRDIPRSVLSGVWLHGPATSNFRGGGRRPTPTSILDMRTSVW